MPIERGSASKQISRLREAGEAKTEAENFLFDRFFRMLLTDSERSFSKSPAVDAHAVAQSAIRTTLTDIHSGKLPAVQSRGELAALLWYRMKNKQTDARRRLRAGRRETSDQQEDFNDITVQARDSRSDDQMTATELCVEFLQTLPLESQLSLVYQVMGFEYKEIAAMAGISERAVGTHLADVKKKAQAFRRAKA